MGCCGEREKASPLESQKWDYITLSDFKATSGLTYFAYAWLWVMAMVGVAVYAADTFTAVNLLAFDKWSSQIKPAVPIKYSKWIFAGCILFSWVLVIFEWIRAIRVIRRGGVAESYMDYLAANAQSMRSQGWKRFLVFSELTKSKKRVDYVAFFIYFAFKGAIRIILAEGPRQVINAITLYSVMDAGDLVRGVSAQGESPWETFGRNIEHIANTNREEAVILFSMLFTLVLWLISAICLVIAVILYLFFMWHYIPQKDGRLHRYVRRKIDKRLERIVEKKVQAAIEEEERQRQKVETKVAKKGDRPMQPLRQPTLPQMGPSPDLKKDDEKLPNFGIHRQNTSTTVSTLPLYSSQPPTRNVSSSSRSLHRQPTLPDLDESRPIMPTRTFTQGSAYTTTSHEMNAPLLENAGYAGEPSAPPPVASLERPVPPIRSMTSSTQGSQRSYNSRPGYGNPGPPRAYTPMDRPGTSYSQRPLPPGPNRSFTPMERPGTVNSQQDYPRGPPRTFTPVARSYTSQSQRPYQSGPPRPPGPPIRANTTQTFANESYPGVSPVSPMEIINTQRFQSPAPISPQDRQAPIYNTAAPTISRQYGSLHSQQSSFSRPGPYAKRKQSYGSANGSAPQTPANPYSPSQEANLAYNFSPIQQEPPIHGSAYEMIAQPTLAVEKPQPAAGGYRAFNPAALSSSNDQTAIHSREQSGLPNALTPVTSSQQPNVAAYGPPGSNGNYFGHVVQKEAPRLPRQDTTYTAYTAYTAHVPSGVYTNSANFEPTHTPHERVPSRAVSGYGDILDAYAGHSGTNSISAPGGEMADDLRSKSPSPDFATYPARSH